MTPRGDTVTRRRLEPAADHGFSTVEVVLLVPVFVLVLLLIVAVGQVEQARVQVEGTAREAARAASLTRTPHAAQVQAQASAELALSSQSITCVGGPDVSLDTTGFAPGGQVEVTIGCRTRLADLGMDVLAATKTLTATAASPIEIYRSGP